MPFCVISIVIVNVIVMVNCPLPSYIVNQSIQTDIYHKVPIIHLNPRELWLNHSRISLPELLTTTKDFRTGWGNVPLSIRRRDTLIVNRAPLSIVNQRIQSDMDHIIPIIHLNPRELWLNHSRISLPELLTTTKDFRTGWGNVPLSIRRRNTLMVNRAPLSIVNQRIQRDMDHIIPIIHLNPREL